MLLDRGGESAFRGFEQRRVSSGAGVCVIHEAWNSPATLAWVDTGDEAVIAVGRLFEMIDLLLSMPAEVRNQVGLHTEFWDTPLRRDAVQALSQRNDFPVLV